MNKEKRLGNDFFGAFIISLPVVIGYIPIGFAFGVLAAQAGLTIAETGAMSLLVYAGSAQMAAVGLIESGTGAASIGITTFFINLRHLLMGSALAPYLSPVKKHILAWFSFQLTDETFALNSYLLKKEGSPGRLNLPAINFWPHLSWIGSSILGVWAGGLMTGVERWGLDYALPAMFIALLLVQITSLSHVIASLGAAGLSTMVYLQWGAGWNVIAAAVAGAAIGVGCDYWRKKTLSSSS